MKKNRISINCICLLINAIFFMSCESSVPRALMDADIQHLRDVTTAVQNSWNQGNREMYVNRFSSEAVFMAPNMKALVGKDAIRNFANSFPDVKVEFVIEEIMGSADYAYVRGKYLLRNSEDTLVDEGKYVSIWKKFPENSWLLTHDIFSSDLPVAATK